MTFWKNFWKTFFKSPASDPLFAEKHRLRDKVSSKYSQVAYAWFVPGYGWGIRLRTYGNTPDPYVCKYFSTELEAWKAATEK